jgi:hypothetical protein
MSWVSLIPYAIKAGQSLMGGSADKAAGKAAAALEISQSQQTARNIRRRAKEAQGAAAADYAAAGVDVGQGSPVEAERQIAFESEYDALNALLTGKRRAAAAKKGGALSAQASAFDAAGSLYSGWLTARDRTTSGS